MEKNILTGRLTLLRLIPLALALIFASVLMPSAQALNLDGNGTYQRPFAIYTIDDLLAFRDEVNNGRSFEGQYVRLGTDLRLISAWTPIGSEEHPFKGVFDGGGHRITNVKVSSDDACAGLFGFVESAIIRNLGTSGTVVSTRDGASVGGIVGCAAGDSTVFNCKFAGDITGAGNASSGGIAGRIGPGGTVKGCTASGGASGGQGASVGGIAGMAEQLGLVTNCVSSSNAVGGKDACVGGIMGQALGQSRVTNCKALGALVENANAGSTVHRILGAPRGESTVSVNYANYMMVVNGDVILNSHEQYGYDKLEGMHCAPSLATESDASERPVLQEPQAPGILSIAALPQAGGAVLTIKAENEGPIRYQWRVVNVNGIWVDIRGAKSSTYTYTGLIPGQRYEVRCVIHANNFMVESDPITFTAG